MNKIKNDRVKYKEYITENSFWKSLISTESCCFIMSAWNSRWMNEGAHNYFVIKKGNLYSMFNYSCAENNNTKNGVDGIVIKASQYIELFSDYKYRGELFICAYIIS